MALDRRITVRRTVATRDSLGEGEVTENTDFHVWASRRDADARDIEEAGGTRDEVHRKWRIRWRSDIADVPVSELSVIDGGATFNVTTLAELTGRNAMDRRRWLQIEGVHSP